MVPAWEDYLRASNWLEAPPADYSPAMRARDEDTVHRWTEAAIAAGLGALIDGGEADR